jgi:hypothetical protein
VKVTRRETRDGNGRKTGSVDEGTEIWAREDRGDSVKQKEERRDYEAGQTMEEAGDRARDARALEEDTYAEQKEYDSHGREDMTHVRPLQPMRAHGVSFVVGEERDTDQRRAKDTASV